jgi:hypothetical protein
MNFAKQYGIGLLGLFLISFFFFQNCTSSSGGPSPSPAPAAPAPQATPAAATNPVTVDGPFTSNSFSTSAILLPKAVVGQLVLVMVHYNSKSSGGTMSISDSSGNVWTKVTGSYFQLSQSNPLNKSMFTIYSSLINSAPNLTLTCNSCSQANGSVPTLTEYSYLSVAGVRSVAALNTAVLSLGGSSSGFGEVDVSMPIGTSVLSTFALTEFGSTAFAQTDILFQPVSTSTTTTPPTFTFTAAGAIPWNPNTITMLGTNSTGCNTASAACMAGVYYVFNNAPNLSGSVAMVGLVLQ